MPVILVSGVECTQVVVDIPLLMSDTAKGLVSLEWECFTCGVYSLENIRKIGLQKLLHSAMTNLADVIETVHTICEGFPLQTDQARCSQDCS